MADSGKEMDGTVGQVTRMLDDARFQHHLGLREPQMKTLRGSTSKARSKTDQERANSFQETLEIDRGQSSF
ncbi:hypothetical protein CVT26_000978 [Gymnopilus dilepis]|uniref:Uncharacterized protein n=1 Tax=Gymnopilus dilepis TaxID=231916 RepID=A0A409WB76_9AGAR|nr:hypothetical protein CVT26_000978 [Gymnopilus dilepis]